MDTLMLLLEHLPEHHPLKTAIELLLVDGQDDPLRVLGDLALARFGDEPGRDHAILERGGERVPLDGEAMAEIANALRTKERLVRGGFYDETADGCDIAGWATLLEQLGDCFG